MAQELLDSGDTTFPSNYLELSPEKQIEEIDYYISQLKILLRKTDLDRNTYYSIEDSLENWRKTIENGDSWEDLVNKDRKIIQVVQRHIFSENMEKTHLNCRGEFGYGTQALWIASL